MTTKLVILSDTHESKQYMIKILGLLEDLQPDQVWHLGDYYQDAAPIIDAGYPLIRVPGTWTAYYQNPLIDNRRFEDVEGWRFFLTHTPDPHFNDLPDDPNPEEIILKKKCDVFLHGHLHQARIEEHHGVLIVNPGHLSVKDLRSPPSFAIITVQKDALYIEIRSLFDNALVLEKTVSK